MQLTEKTLSGLTAISERWPGPVEVVARGVATDPSENLGSGWMECDNAPVPVHLGDPLKLIPMLRPDIVQTPLTLHDQPAGKSRVPVALVAENPALEMLRYATATAATRQWPRMALGAARQHFALKQVVRSAQSLACNGWAAWETFGTDASRHATRPLLFFDTRLRHRDVVDSATTAHRNVKVRHIDSSLRLAFSGRFHPAKGAEEAVEVATILEKRGVPHHLTMIGAGPLEATLRGRAGRTVEIVTPRQFDPDWVDLIRTSVDLMVLPHVQGDPSGTYLEAAGLGVPIVGFRNRALSGHVRHIGLGWTVRRGDVAALAAKVEELLTRPEEVAAAGLRGASFMRQHSMEQEFDRRVEHLLATLQGLAT